MTSILQTRSPVKITVGNESAAGPRPELLANLPILHQILGEVVEDWHRAVEPYEERMKASQESTEYVCGVAVFELQPALLKSLFSYAFFFVAADHAYKALYDSLNRVNKLAKVTHGKPPVKTAYEYVEKTQAIRDWSIAHFPSDKASAVDAMAAMSWQPMSLSRSSDKPDKPWNLRDLTFGAGRFAIRDQNGKEEQSRDLEVRGLDNLHKDCLAYLEAFDTVCADYLDKLHAWRANQG